MTGKSRETDYEVTNHIWDIATRRNVTGEEFAIYQTKLTQGIYHKILLSVRCFATYRTIGCGGVMVLHGLRAVGAVRHFLHDRRRKSLLVIRCPPSGIVSPCVNKGPRCRDTLKYFNYR